jgi:predicted phosphodiesterase
MRVLLITDLHANLPATEAVLDHARREGWDRALVLGDLVGYGADPAAVIDIVRGLPNATVIRGNHDKVVCGVESPMDFNAVARQAAEWTTSALDEDRLAYLRGLPRGPVSIANLGVDTAICHGAPWDEDYYIFDNDDAANALEVSPATLVLCGHTHVQIGFREVRAAAQRLVAPIDAEELDVSGRVRMLINPGSVGQPRDGDPRAAYGILDTERHTVRLFRVPYNIAAAQARILDAGLHHSLADRLALGR